MLVNQTQAQFLSDFRLKGCSALGTGRVTGGARTRIRPSAAHVHSAVLQTPWSGGRRQALALARWSTSTAPMFNRVLGGRGRRPAYPRNGRAYLAAHDRNILYFAGTVVGTRLGADFDAERPFAHQ
jgi:hypothetical protein